MNAASGTLRVIRAALVAGACLAACGTEDDVQTRSAEPQPDAAAGGGGGDVACPMGVITPQGPCAGHEKGCSAGEFICDCVDGHFDCTYAVCPVEEFRDNPWPTCPHGLKLPPGCVCQETREPLHGNIFCTCWGPGGPGTGGSGNSGDAATGGTANALDGGRGGADDASAGGTKTATDAATDASSAADGATPGAALGTFQLTYYWVTAEADFTGANDTTIYDPSCTALATVPSAFAASLDIEGTGRLTDGRVINVAGACGCLRSPCYAVVDAAHPWGYGVQNRALVPFHSVAVDRTVIPYGTHLYIPELDGVTMPGDASYGGFVHDGCVSADDTGGGIIGKHIDLFVGLEANYAILDGQLGLTQVTVRDGGSRCP